MLKQKFDTLLQLIKEEKENTDRKTAPSYKNQNKTSFLLDEATLHSMQFGSWSTYHPVNGNSCSAPMKFICLCFIVGIDRSCI